MFGRNIAHSKVGMIVSLGLLVVMAGCAMIEKPRFRELVWPEPPLSPRIKFVGVLQSQDDLGKSAGQLFTEALLGAKKQLSLQQPMGVAPSRDGKRLYVTDYAQPAVFVFDFAENRVSLLGSEAHGFKSPIGITTDDKDNVYVVDSEPKLIRVFDRSGRFIRNITHDSLERPTGIAVDSKRGRIYVADSSRRRSDNHVVHTFSMDGDYLKALGGKGNEEGKFAFPAYLAVDANGNLYVSDTLNARVQAFDPEGRYLKTFGQRGDTFGMFDKPKGVALDSFGNVYVVDSSWSHIQIFNQRRDVLLFFGGRGHIPGLLSNPTGIAIDQKNRIYVANAFNRRVEIYQLINTKAEDSFVTLPNRPEKGGDSSSTASKEGVKEAKVK
jgi:DNA-binding beta-propeller fold protein YncE